MPGLLFEIGTEEIPARFFPGTLDNLKDVTENLLKDNLIDFSGIKTYATPRRLALIVEEVAEYQKNSSEEYFGPPVIKAFDADGKPTKAAVGFARSHGIDPEKLIRKKKGKGEYVVAVISKEGARVIDLLGDVLVNIVSLIKFPKSMRWGESKIRFVRPIRWLTALYGNKTISFKLGNMQCSNKTYGHRFLSNQELSINDSKEYLDILNENYVILDHDVRREIIKKQMNEIAEGLNAVIVSDEELLETVNFLAEYPNAVAGSFNEKFLQLPVELLTTVMKEHQKYFALRNISGDLINKFIVISNTAKENSDIVKKGAERVLKARFEDARFYFAEDTNMPLIERVENLKNMTYHEGLGTLFDKVERLLLISDFLYKIILSSKKKIDSDISDNSSAVKIADMETVRRAVRLSKTDLTTGVVREFPELQGIIGMHYARLNGEKDEVAKAIREQYLPAYAGDNLPGTWTGSILSLADRIDNIISFFSIGLIPTGSEDPYALRRQASGIIAVLIEREVNVSLDELLSGIIKISGRDINKDEVLNFFRQRCEYLLLSMGYSHDVIQAGMYNFQEIPSFFLIKRMKELNSIKQRENYSAFLFAIKRVHNIIPKGFDGEVNERLLNTTYEETLYKKATEVKDIVDVSIKKGDYRNACIATEMLIKPINDFFDNVLVMEKDEDIRNNRLSILKTVWDVSIKVADFSRLAEK